MSEPAIGVLISGGGTNLQALVDACRAGVIPGRIALVVSDQPGAFGLQRAEKAGIPTRILPRREFPGPAAHDQAILAALEEAGVVLVCLAGYMRILSDEFVRHFRGRLLNIHPSLLPAFPGLHVQRRAIEAGVRFSGATVHFVVEAVDAGPIVLQAVVPILQDDTEDTLARRILAQEHRIYPQAVRWFLQGRLTVTAGRVVIREADETPGAALVQPPLDGP